MMDDFKKETVIHGFTNYTVDAHTVTNVPCVHNLIFGDVIKAKDMYRAEQLIDFMRSNHLQELAFDSKII